MSATIELKHVAASAARQNLIKAETRDNGILP